MLFRKALGNPHSDRKWPSSGQPLLESGRGRNDTRHEPASLVFLPAAEMFLGQFRGKVGIDTTELQIAGVLTSEISDGD